MIFKAARAQHASVIRGQSFFPQCFIAEITLTLNNGFQRTYVKIEQGFCR